MILKHLMSYLEGFANHNTGFKDSYKTFSKDSKTWLYRFSVLSLGIHISIVYFKKTTINTAGKDRTKVSLNRKIMGQIL